MQTVGDGRAGIRSRDETGGSHGRQLHDGITTLVRRKRTTQVPQHLRYPLELPYEQT